MSPNPVEHTPRTADHNLTTTRLKDSIARSSSSPEAPAFPGFFTRAIAVVAVRSEQNSRLQATVFGPTGSSSGIGVSKELTKMNGWFKRTSPNEKSIRHSNRSVRAPVGGNAPVPANFWNK